MFLKEFSCLRVIPVCITISCQNRGLLFNLVKYFCVFMLEIFYENSSLPKLLTIYAKRFHHRSSKIFLFVAVFSRVLIINGERIGYQVPSTQFDKLIVWLFRKTSVSNCLQCFSRGYPFQS